MPVFPGCHRRYHICRVVCLGEPSAPSLCTGRSCPVAGRKQIKLTGPVHCFCLLGYDQNQRRLCGVQIHICATFKAGFYLSIAVPVESYNRGQRINGGGAGIPSGRGSVSPRVPTATQIKLQGSQSSLHHFHPVTVRKRQGLFGGHEGIRTLNPFGSRT